MTRIHRFTPDELDERQRAVYDAIAAGPRGGGPPSVPVVDEQGRLEGPFNAMLLAPALGEALQRLGGIIRFRGALGDRARELAILTVAVHHRSGFEQRAHEILGADAGLTKSEIEAVRTGGPLDLPDAEEAAVLAVTRELLARGELDGVAYRAAVPVLGEAGLFELTTLIGYYTLLALQMRVFEVP